jgi:hypothetical protein
MLLSQLLFSCTGGCIDTASDIYKNSILSEHQQYVNDVKKEIDDVNELNKELIKKRKEVYDTIPQKINVLKNIEGSIYVQIEQEFKTLLELNRIRLELIGVTDK